MVEKFLRLKEKVHRINELLEQEERECGERWIEDIRQISGEILEEL